MYYQQTPISEKPEKAGYYHGLYDGSPVYDYFNGTEWKGDMSHWLKPITGVVMTEEELEQIKTDQYHKGYDRGYDEGGTLF